MKDWREWTELLFPLLIFGAIYLYRHIRQFSKAKRLREVAPYINGDVVLRPFVSPRLKGAYMGLPFQMVFLSASRGSPERMQLKLTFACHFSMEIIPRGRRPGLEELFLKGKAVDTGDEAFDNAVLIKVNKEDKKALLFLDNSVNRQAIMEAFRNGFEVILFSENQLVLDKPGDFLGQDNFTAEEALKDLEIAARLLQQV